MTEPCEPAGERTRHEGGGAAEPVMVYAEPPHFCPRQAAGNHYRLPLAPFR